MKRLLLVLSALFITNSVFSQLPATNLVAWYPFCADTTDHSGNTDQLIVNGTGFTTPPVLDTDRYGNLNDAYEFNGVSSAMHYNTFFSSSGNLGYSCWIKPYLRQSSSIIYNGKVNTNGFGLVMNNGTIGSAGDSVSVQFGGIGLQISAPVTLNQWHHIVFTRNANTYEFYVDTVLIGTFTDVFFPLTSNDVFNVGYDMASASNSFTGRIDDIAVYNTHLSVSDVRALYHFNPDILAFTLGNDTAICTNSIVLAPSVGTPGSLSSWSTGTTVLSSSSQYTATPSDFPGTNYTLSISKIFGCTLRDTINVRHITTRVNIGPRDTAFCDGNILTLNTRVIPETYLWSTGDTTASIKAGTAGTYWVTVDSLGCSGSDTITIAIKPRLTVNLGKDTASCLGNFVTLQSSVLYSASVTYVWQALPILAAPVTTAAFTASVTGTYWLTVTDTNGCPAADTVNVLIVTDTFTFNEPKDTGICQGIAFATNVTSNPGINYQWRPTTGMATSNVASPTIVTSVSATYVLTASYPGCPDILDTFHLDVQPNPIVAYFGPPRSVCINDTLHFTAVVDPASYTHYTYHWSPGASLDDSTTSTVVFTAGDSTNLVVTVSTPAGCFGKDSVQINVHPSKFDSILLTSPQNICPHDSVQFLILPLTIPEPTTITYQWIPTTYLSDPTSASPWARPVNSIDYIVVGTSQFGCKDTLSTYVLVHPAAVIYLQDSTVIYPGGSYQLSPQTNCTQFSWWPEIGLTDTTISNPIATPAVNTTYIVRGTTEFGCVTTDSIHIRVSQTTPIFVPNAFTPGADINNTLKVMKNGIAELLYFRIYNRWGTIIYDSKNIDEGWDGTYQGKPQPFGVYIYQVEAITNNAKVYQKQGNVTLIR
jgi:gliding motility-associated-like protein